jgi:hypothetical protein
MYSTKLPYDICTIRNFLIIYVQYETSKSTCWIWSISQQTDLEFNESIPADLLVGTQHRGSRSRINLEEMALQGSVSKCVDFTFQD